jgi:hypothetical protein
LPFLPARRDDDPTEKAALDAAAERVLQGSILNNDVGGARA